MGLFLLLSFFFSATEMAFASVSRVRMRARADDGDGGAARVLAILENYDRAITTLLIGNNIVNIALATLATVFATRAFGLSAVPAAALITTVIVFIFGETLPKTLAKSHSEGFATKTAGVLSLLMKAFTPLTALFSAVTRFIGRPFRKDDPDPTVTGEELRDLIDGAVEDGGLDAETGALVQSAIRYTDASVRDIMTPWKKVHRLPLSAPPQEVLDAVRKSHNSRLPVIDANGDCVGLLRVRKYLKQTLRGSTPAWLEEVMDPVRSIPDTMEAGALLPLMSSRQTHFCLVRDQWDNILGVVTMEDLLERIVGDIWDEDDEAAFTLGGGAS